MLNEFDLINRYFADRTLTRADVVTGIGDDAAVIALPVEQKLVVAVDTLVCGVHFSNDASPYDIGYKALAVNLSDFAAMAAVPTWMTLSLTLPQCSESWLKDFSEGLLALAEEFSIELVGGDTTRGPLSVTVQLMGVQSKDEASVLRSGARPGDLVYVTGCLGDAGLGLLVSQGILPVNKVFDSAVQRLHRPRARVEFGQALSGLATAGIDVSDGFLADLGHIIEASHVGARLNLDVIPLSHAYHYLETAGLAHLLVKEEAELSLAPSLKFALSAGDDYELCFTIPPEQQEQLDAVAASMECMITPVGTIETGASMVGVDVLGKEIQLAKRGYQHF